MNGLFDNKKAWQQLIEDTSAQRPTAGKTVKVTEGKKHLGKVGIVFWHGVDRFSDSWRYCSDAQAHLRDVIGRHGYRVGIQTSTGEKFFTGADRVEVIDAQGNKAA